MKCAIALALCLGCGRVSFDARSDADAIGADAEDPGPPDAVPAQTCGAWQPTERLTTISSGFVDFGPTLSDDGRRLYLHSDPSGDFEIYVASRATIADPFGPAAPIPEVSAPASDSNPSITADELVLLFDSNRGGGGKCLFTFTRDVITDDWANPVRQDALCTADPAAGGELSRDGLTLYYTRLEQGGNWGTIMVTTRATRSEAFPVGTPVPGINANGSLVGYPALSFDARTIYFETETPLELWVATRPSLDAPFEVAQQVSVNQADGVEGDADISRDGQELYFTSNRTGGAGGFDIYRAARTCTPVL